MVANVPPTPISLAYEERLGGSWISVMTIIITSISILLGGGSLTSYEWTTLIRPYSSNELGSVITLLMNRTVLTLQHIVMLKYIRTEHDRV